MAEKQDLACLPLSLYSRARYHFSPSHPLKIAATLQRQRQSGQGAARAFIFKCSLWPSKSSDADVLMDALPKIKDSLARALSRPWPELNGK